MNSFLKRQSRFSGFSGGLLNRDHFQAAYATSDIERSMTDFARCFGVTRFRRLEGPLPEGGQIHIELAWVGNVMFELLTAWGPGSELYMDRLPASGFAVRLHHLGYLLYEQRHWDALEAAAAAAGRPLLADRDKPGFLRSCFVDAPELGHYLEYILPAAGGREFFENVPRNDGAPL